MKKKNARGSTKERWLLSQSLSLFLGKFDPNFFISNFF